MAGLTLRGITWDDPRGWGPLAEVGRVFGNDVTVRWDMPRVGSRRIIPCA